MWREFIFWVASWFSVKVFRDDNGKPYLYRYRVLSWGDNGPGVYLHHYVMSDPDKGYHNHPWEQAYSIILSGGYTERVHNKSSRGYRETYYGRGSLRTIQGQGIFHRIVIAPGDDAWTLIAFSSRNKPWGTVGTDGRYQEMSTAVVANVTPVDQRLEPVVDVTPVNPVD